MFARATTFFASPERVEDGIRNFRDQVLPVAEVERGFRGGYLLVDHKSGRMLSITLWDSERDLQDSEPTAATLRMQTAETIGAAAIPMVEPYEVAVQPLQEEDREAA